MRGRSVAWVVHSSTFSPGLSKMKSRNCLSICAALLLLASCSDNDSTPDDSQILPDEQAGEITEPAPEGDVPESPLSSTPGGDTTAIAGLWNARSGELGQIDERYVGISVDGLYTEYDYRQDDLESDGNCYITYGPLTLTPEDAATNTYSLPDDRHFSATSNEDKSVLNITYAEESLQEWAALTGISTDDFSGCADIQE